MDVQRPDGGFYLWARTPGDDTVFTRELFTAEHVTVVPGSYLSREVNGVNPGAGRVRMALVRAPCRMHRSRRAHCPLHPQRLKPDPGWRLWPPASDTVARMQSGESRSWHPGLYPGYTPAL